MITATAIAGLFLPWILLLLGLWLFIAALLGAVKNRKRGGNAVAQPDDADVEPFPDEPGLGEVLWQRTTVDREVYLLYGTVFLAIKHNIDRIVSTAVFGKPWSLFNYLKPSDILNVSSLPQSELPYFLTMVALALPFIGIGVALTAKRLRDCGWPVWLVLLFFAPFINFLFFLLLSICPSAAPLAKNGDEPAHKFLDRLVPHTAFGSAAFAVIITSILGAAIVLLGTRILENYGWSLFVGWPFALGFFGVLLFSYHQKRSWKQCFSLVSLIVFIHGFLLLALMLEGIVCILMAAPLAWILSLIGAAAAFAIVKNPAARNRVELHAFSLAVILPLTAVYEAAIPEDAVSHPLTTSIEISAPPEVVWNHVVSFSEMPPPQDWILRLGFAFPLRARIEGHGVGAVRHCEFTTGSFVEPITVWDPPRLLRFSVSGQPPIMEEFNPLGEVFPAHIDDYLRSHGGQFLLSEIPAGTRIDATTWYSHRIWPAAYWRLWSDEIIHRIHLRVLRHIKSLAESR